MNQNETMTDVDIEMLQKLYTDLVALYQKYEIDGYVELKHETYKLIVNYLPGMNLYNGLVMQYGRRVLLFSQYAHETVCKCMRYY